MAVPMTQDQVTAVWRVLVEHAGAPGSPDSWKARDFLYHQTAGSTDEYRFQGSLGFGGKFFNCNGRWYVTAYPEAVKRWPEMQQVIDATNEALAALRNAMIGA
jgi:hypothetical protein